MSCPILSTGICKDLIALEDESGASLLTSSSSLEGYPIEDAPINVDGAWRPTEDDEEPWVDVTFTVPTLITAIVTHGYDGMYVTAYVLQYSTESDADDPKLVDVVSPTDNGLVCWIFLILSV